MGKALISEENRAEADSILNQIDQIITETQNILKQSGNTGSGYGSGERLIELSEQHRDLYHRLSALTTPGKTN